LPPFAAPLANGPYLRIAVVRGVVSEWQLSPHCRRREAGKRCVGFLFRCYPDPNIRKDGMRRRASRRATGVTAYLKNGGTLERAAQMANHARTRTTQLYDRRAEEVTLDEVERILV
jgi:hypothetical protein